RPTWRWLTTPLSAIPRRASAEKRSSFPPCSCRPSRRSAVGTAMKLSAAWTQCNWARSNFNTPSARAQEGFSQATALWTTRPAQLPALLAQQDADHLPRDEPVVHRNRPQEFPQESAADN